MNNNTFYSIMLQACLSGTMIYLITIAIIFFTKRAKNKEVTTASIVISAIIIYGLVFTGVYVELTEDSSVESELVVNDSIKQDGVKANTLPKYERIETEEVHYANIERFVIKVLIKDEVSKQQLIDISEEIVNETINQRRTFHALAIHYYTHMELVNNRASLGIFTYAPNGRWKDASEAKSDFSNFLGDTTELIEKNWEDKPTDQEIRMYQDYDGFEMRDDGIKFVAEKYNISEGEAKNHIDRVYHWIYNIK